MLAVREKLRDLRRGSDQQLSKPDKDHSNEEMRRRCSKDGAGDHPEASSDDVIMTSPVTLLSCDRQHQLVVKCVKLLTQKHFIDVAANNPQVRRHSTLHIHLYSLESSK